MGGVAAADWREGGRRIPWGGFGGRGGEEGSDYDCGALELRRGCNEYYDGRMRAAGYDEQGDARCADKALAAQVFAEWVWGNIILSDFCGRFVGSRWGLCM